MNDHDALGYLASALVLATFSMRDMVALRVFAIASNLAFIGYAALAGIAPVLLLHALLLPMNLLRLGQALRRRPARSGPPRPPSAGSGHGPEPAGGDRTAATPPKTTSLKAMQATAG